MIPAGLSLPLEDGGHSCGECGGLLMHEDFIGNHETSYFIVKGYECPHCGAKWFNPKFEPKTVSMKRSFVEKFDWRRIAAPSRISKNMTSINAAEMGVVFG